MIHELWNSWNVALFIFLKEHHCARLKVNQSKSDNNSQKIELYHLQSQSFNWSHGGSSQNDFRAKEGAYV